MSRRRCLLASLALLLGCGSDAIPLELAPSVREPAEAEAAACFGGHPVSTLPILAVYEPPPGWVLGRVEVGRCERSRVPLELHVLAEERGGSRELGRVLVTPSRGAAWRYAAFVARVDGPVRFELSRVGDAGSPVPGFLDVRWSSLPERPAALPEGTEVLFARTIELDGDSLHAKAPAGLRVRARPGVHTLTGRVATSAPSEVSVVRVGAEDPALMRWAMEEGSAPFTVTFASAEASAFELRSESRGEAMITWTALRHDERWLPPPPPPPPPAPLPPRDDVALLFSDASGTVARCVGRPSFLAPAPSRLVLPAGPARELRAGVAPCAPTTPGHATWRIVTGSGIELWSHELSWEAGEQPAEWFGVPLAAGEEAVWITEGEAGAPTAWIEPRASLALTPAAIESSGFSESELNHNYAPEKAFDGDPWTEWLAPDGQPAWIELRLAEPVAIRGVALLDGHNPGYDDRATERFTIRVYAGDAIVFEQDGTFRQLEVSPEWIAFPVTAEGVDRVRVVVHGHHGVGASIAEVDLL